MGINDIILYIMTGFMVLGAVDKAFMNSRLGFGEKFEEGFMAMGSLMLAMGGVITLAPLLAAILKPVIVPLYKMVGADPAMFATTLLANDMGGYPLALQMAENPAVGRFAGIILGAMMGPTIVFSIPVALGIIEKKDHAALAKGILLGMITIPFGCLAGGLVMLSSEFTMGMMLINIIPVIIFSGLIATGLKMIPDKMIKGFTIFGRGVVSVITIGLAMGIIEALSPFKFFPEGSAMALAPLSDSIEIIGSIAIVLAGAFPMVMFITKVFNKPLLVFGKKLGMGDVAAAGMVATLANNIPMFTLMKDMDERGKVINVAFAVSAAFVFGDHLGFTAGVERGLILAMIVGKLVGGITAVILACKVTPVNGAAK
ncbi:MAG: ethanolamine utilization protein EutH [Aminobacteriaceae bacterium]